MIATDGKPTIANIGVKPKDPRKPTYVVLQVYPGGERVVRTSGRIALARKSSDGIAGRRIVQLDRDGQVLKLRDWRGGSFTIHAREIV